MPTWLAVVLIAAMGLGLVLRLALASSPLTKHARPITRSAAFVATVGALGLVLHCTAMFYPVMVGSIAGSERYVTIINHMGPGSVALYVVPAALLLAGLHKQRSVGLVMLALALLAVGVTMYDHGSLMVHLVAISASVVILASIVALLIAPRRQETRRSQAP